MSDVLVDDPNVVIKSTKMKISKAIEAGFKCAVCAFETVTYDDTVPVACLNCHTANPKIVWKNIVTHQLTVKSIQL